MASENRLIDAEKFLQWLVKRFKCVPLIGSCDNDSESVKLLLAQAPTVDAVEVVHGRWVLSVVDDDELMTSTATGHWCNRCWKPGEKHFNYCPNCGAKMDGDSNG